MIAGTYEKSFDGVNLPSRRRPSRLVGAIALEFFLGDQSLF